MNNIYLKADEEQEARLIDKMLREELEGNYLRDGISVFYR